MCSVVVELLPRLYCFTSRGLMRLCSQMNRLRVNDDSGALDLNDPLSPRDRFRKIGLESRPDLLAAVQFGEQSTHRSQTGRGKRHAAEDSPASDKRARMTLKEAENRLRNSPSAGIRYVVANEDGSFSIVGHNASSEPEKLEESFYDSVVVATNKTTTRPGGFVHLMQAAAAQPITLRKLIQCLIATYRPPHTKKDPEMVIRVRTRDAFMRLGYLRRVTLCSCEGVERSSSLARPCRAVATGEQCVVVQIRRQSPGRVSPRRELAEFLKMLQIHSYRDTPIW
jgi:hypothetical protein